MMGIHSRLIGPNLGKPTVREQAYPPFTVFVRSYPDLNYKIIHGIRYAHEAYECEVYGDEKYICCTTRNIKGDFYGRITEYLKNEALNR